MAKVESECSVVIAFPETPSTFNSWPCDTSGLAEPHLPLGGRSTHAQRYQYASSARETIWPEVNPIAHVVPMANRPRQQEVTVPNAPGTIHSSTDAAGGNSGHDMRNLRVNGTPSSVLHRRGDGDSAPIPAG